jgi:hypothetical protein
VAFRMSNDTDLRAGWLVFIYDGGSRMENTLELAIPWRRAGRIGQRRVVVSSRVDK